MIELRPLIFGDIVFDDGRLPRWKVLAEDPDTRKRGIVTIDLLDRFERRSSLWWPVLWRTRKATLRYSLADEVNARWVSLDINEGNTRIVEAQGLAELLMPSTLCAMEPLINTFPHAGFVVTTRDARGLQIDVIAPCAGIILKHCVSTLRRILDGKFLSALSDESDTTMKTNVTDSRSVEDWLRRERFGEIEPRAQRATTLQFITTLMRYGAAQLFALPPVRGKAVARVCGMVFGNGSSHRQYLAESIDYFPSSGHMENSRWSRVFIDGEPYKPMPSREAMLSQCADDIADGEFGELRLGFFDRTGYYVPLTGIRAATLA